MSWVGGDIAGLQHMGQTLQRAPGLIEPVVQGLTNGVDKLGDDANWSGDAAEAFRKYWTSDAVRAGGIGTVAADGGSIISDLANNLAALERDLYDAAHEASSRGAQIGPDGKPLPLVITGDASTPAAQQAMSAQADYQAAYAEDMQLAQGFRLHAATRLSAIVEPIADGDDKHLKPDQWTTIGDYLKAFYVVPNDRNTLRAKKLPDKIKQSRDEFRDLRKQLRAAKDDYAKKGLSLPKDNPARLAHLSASKDIDAMAAKLADAEAGKGERPLSAILNTKIGDIEKVVPGAAKALPKSLDFLKDIPVVDVAATGAVAELQAIDDHEKGWSETTAHVNDYAAGALGLAGGAGAVAVAAAAPVEVPAAIVAAGAGAVVIGVGSLGYNSFHEHWSEDVHDHGVVAGILHGSSNVLADTGGDFADLGEGAWHATKSLWKSVFG